MNNAHVYGIEAHIQYKPTEWLKLYTNYTFTQAINDDDGSRLSSIPKHLVNSGFYLEPLKGLNFHAYTHVVSSRPIPDTLSTDALGDLGLAFFDGSGNAAGTTLGSYFTVNLTASYKHELNLSWLDSLTYSLKMNNLLNKNYQEKFGYDMPGFNFLAGITAKFKHDG